MASTGATSRVAAVAAREAPTPSVMAPVASTGGAAGGASMSAVAASVAVSPRSIAPVASTFSTAWIAAVAARGDTEPQGERARGLRVRDHGRLRDEPDPRVASVQRLQVGALLCRQIPAEAVCRRPTGVDVAGGERDECARGVHLDVELPGLVGTASRVQSLDVAGPVLADLEVVGRAVADEHGGQTGIAQVDRIITGCDRVTGCEEIPVRTGHDVRRRFEEGSLSRADQLAPWGGY